MLILNGGLLTVTNLFLVIFLTSSIREKERRAALLSTIALAANSCVWLFFAHLSELHWVALINVLVVIVFGVFIIISTVRYFPHTVSRDLSGAEKFDERDIMFARNRLQYFPNLASKYYSDHTEKRNTDEKIHSKPELGEPGSIYYDSLQSPVFDAAFTYLHRTRGASKGKAAQEKKKPDPHEITAVIKNIGHYYGAVDVGITPVKPYHIYSYAGRDEEKWGEEIRNAHSYAIVIIVPMRVDMMKQAPGLPAILESSRLYVEAAKIAHIIAEYLRSFGYDARSHTDGNYEILCVPLAVDAGLGALGRMGIFMHPVHGPCVRISTVTTDMELTPTKTHAHTASIGKFCEICKKCSDNCPTQSICGEEEPVSRGFHHWSIDQEKCFSFWKNIGTDCGFCIRVCPYTKPDTLIHKLVRFYISRNPINQRIALFFDDLFYGRKITIAKG